MSKVVTVLASVTLLALLVHCGDDGNSSEHRGGSGEGVDPLSESCRAACCQGARSDEACVTECIADSGACSAELERLGSCAERKSCCALSDTCAFAVDDVRACLGKDPTGVGGGGGTTTTGTGGGCGVGSEIKVVCSNGLDDDCDNLIDCDDPDCQIWEVCGGPGTGGAGGSGGSGGSSCLNEPTFLSWTLYDAGFYAAAMAPGGELLLAGRSYGVVDIGGGLLGAQNQDGVFVVKLDAAGQQLWSVYFEDAGESEIHAMTVDGSGNVALTGLTETLDFGSGPLPAGMFVLKLDPNGQLLFAQPFGQANSYSIATGPNDQIVVTGTFSQQVDFGGGSLQTIGSGDLFVLRLDASGAHMASRTFGSEELDTGTYVAMDADGSVYLGGESYGRIDFGGPELVGDRMFLVKLDASDGFVWSYDQDGDVGVTGIAIRPDDELLVQTQVNVHKLDAATGAPLFTLQVRPEPFSATPPAVDASGAAWLLAEPRADLLGDCSLSNGQRMFLAQIDPAVCGSFVRGASYVHPDKSDIHGGALFVAPNGELVVVGRWLAGTGFDLGGGPNTEPGGFVARFRP